MAAEPVSCQWLKKVEHIQYTVPVKKGAAFVVLGDQTSHRRLWADFAPSTAPPASAYYLHRIIKCWDTTLIATCSHMLQVPLAHRQGTLGQKVKWQQKEKGDGRSVRKDLLIAKCHPHNEKNGLKIYSVSSQSGVKRRHSHLARMMQIHTTVWRQRNTVKT